MGLGADEENKNWSYDVHESCLDMFALIWVKSCERKGGRNYSLKM